MDPEDDFTNKLNRHDSSIDWTEDEKALARVLLQRQDLMAAQSREFIELLFSKNSTLPIRVRNVQVTNGESFRDNFLKLQLRPLLARNLYTLADLFAAIDASYVCLQKHQTLENCLVLLHQLPRKPWQTHRNTLEVVPVFKLIPQKRFFAKTGTNVGNGEGDGYIQFQLRNIFGGAEVVTFDAVTGTKTPALYLFGYSQPLFNDARFLWNTLAFINTRKLDAVQSTVDTKGMTSKLLTRFDLPINYTLSWENCWRSLSNQTSRSLEVMAQLHNTLKSAILATAEYDTRNSHVFPTAGRYMRLGLERSGLLSRSSVAFTKIVWEAQAAQTLGEKHSLLFSGRAGALFGVKDGQSNILDRFNAGGPNDVRAFSLNGLGPKDNNSSMGGDYFVSAGVSLLSQIPKYPESNFKLLQFVNIGRIFSDTLELRNSFSRNYSIGIGSGILYIHPMARFELNLVLPISASSTDYVRKGLQYGVGVSFL